MRNRFYVGPRIMLNRVGSGQQENEKIWKMHQASETGRSPPRYVTGFWGKAKPENGSAVSWHPLAYHSLDVAACAVALVKLRPSWLAALRRVLPGEDDEIISLVFRLSVVHDTGKWGAFQRVVEELCKALGNNPPVVATQGVWRHDNVGLVALVSEQMNPPFDFGGGLLAKALGVELPHDVEVLLATASACHHGRPTQGDINARQSIPPSHMAQAEAFIRDSVALFPMAPAVPSDIQKARSASLILAAIINIADWLGSSQKNFPFEPPIHTVADYWTIAHQRARLAVTRAGLREKTPLRRLSFASLYPKIANPTPLQRIVDEMPIVSGPSLTIIEDATGAGKTEAMILAAGRVMAQGDIAGLFLGLPTMTTANQQAQRQSAIRRMLFRRRTIPTMTLAHSGAGSGLIADDDEARRLWLVDDRRRRLLADIVVGTVDQALMAALPVKFSAVRIAGLIGKVLVLDEIHAYDPYTAEIVDALVALQAAIGGSVILVSASLSAKRKTALTEAFCKAAGLPSANPLVLADSGYPLVTRISDRGTEVFRPDPAPTAPPPKGLGFVRTVADAEQAVLRVAQQGGCALWIRNTVNQSIESAKALELSHSDVTCVHSRFPELYKGARLTQVLERFGPASTAAQRAGGVVVATSIIEMSLDLDFDLVVVDLKPLDDLIQAMGRARRHRRDALGNRFADPLAADQRSGDSVVILTPDPTVKADAKWYSRLLGKARFVHPDIACLWRTATLLEKAKIVFYGNVRSLIEDAHGASHIVAPAKIEDASVEAIGKAIAERSLALPFVKTCGASTGYAHALTWNEDRVPTRLGDSVDVVIVVDTGKGYAPLGSNWKDGLVSVTPGQAAKLKGHRDDQIMPYAWIVPVVAVGADTFRGEACRVSAKHGLELE